MRAHEQSLPLDELYRINESNLALRRELILLGPRQLDALRTVAAWAQRSAPALAAAICARQLAHPSVRAFYEQYGAFRGLTVDDVRAKLEQTCADDLRRLFAEPDAAQPFGVAYFEHRLEAAVERNTTALPLKWYLGSYAVQFDVLARSLRRRFPHRPLLRRRVERALLAVFDYDRQAIADAYLFDTFATMGVAFDRIDGTRQEHDLSDRGRELKRSVRDTLAGVNRVSERLRETSKRMELSLVEVEQAASRIDRAAAEVADGAARQVTAADEARRSSSETSEAADETQAVSREGIAAAEGASEAMEAARRSSVAASTAIAELAVRSNRVGGIVETIAGLAGQTNLLALNAAIEAARAGESGRGFAVVADEVRKLADESQVAAQTISELTREIAREIAAVVETAEDGARATDEGAATVRQALEAFARIGGRVTDVSDRVVRIESAIGDVTAVAGESSDAAREVAGSTRQTSESLQALTAAAAEVQSSAAELEQLLARFSANA